jgi:hypothetical protein
MIGLKRLLWGLQNLASWVSEAKKVAAVAGEVSKARGENRPGSAHPSRARQGTNRAGGMPRNTGSKEGVDLNSQAGQWFVGHQLRFFIQGEDGSLIASRPSWINLYYTEGRSFKLGGRVLLTGELLDENHPHGFALYLREYDSAHRYEATCLGLRVRRRLVEGRASEELVIPFEFERPPLGTWRDFSVEASQKTIAVKFGNQSGVVDGPLDLDGANKIALSPGAKLRDLRITLLD